MQGLVIKVTAAVLLVIAIFASGYSVAWKQSQVRIGELQGAINLANAEAAQVKKEAAAEAERVKQEQLEAVKKLQDQYDEAKKHNDGLSAELADAWVQYRAANKSGSSCPTPSVGNSPEGAGNNAEGEYLGPDRLSEELNKLVQKTAPVIDQRDNDLHFIIQWLNSLPPEVFDAGKT